ncbi:MAG TPA: acylphosphatase, partial [Polyangiaceae bacterium]
MNSPFEPSATIERRAFVVTGVVQGVGFRPFVHRLAREFGLVGFVRNRAGEVELEAEGTGAALDDFESALRHRAPPLAAISECESSRVPARGEQEFSVENSTEQASAVPYIAPDAAVCAECLRELFCAEDRRFHYPFLNCTDCGPRFTIIERAPYDRERTTMSTFVQCEACQSEYTDPTARRFHAEPNACPTCGPRLELLDRNGHAIAAIEPLRAIAKALKLEQIVALKGLGGFHLACLAESERATSE